MSTAFHTLTDILTKDVEIENGYVKIEKIAIPKIQRDYAQGRKNSDAERVRTRFLDALYDALTGEPVTLDFVYGEVEEGVLTPLDGQQRLTTLFLLHWYAAKRENIPSEECGILKKFTYEIRYSARDFISRLISHKPSFLGRISEEIEDEAWFPLEWKKDPTVSSMLVMLDAIDEKFREAKDIWKALTVERKITFCFLALKDMGLTDELYIKMNSRGKPLTLFEHFKAEFEREARRVDENLAKRVLLKIDREWTDLLWKYRGYGGGDYDKFVTDDEFLRYFRFIADIIALKKDEIKAEEGGDVFGLITRYFSTECSEARANIELLEAFFDAWIIGGYSSPADFLGNYISYKHEAGKITAGGKEDDDGEDVGISIDIFGDCLSSYGEKKFSMNKTILLYAITLYLKERKTGAGVSEAVFARRLRIIYNLIRNSKDEIAVRANNNRLPAILEATEKIMLHGVIDTSLSPNYNEHQLREEAEKLDYLEKHPEKEEIIFGLEDHDLLRGQIGIIGIEKAEAYASRFEALFTCDKEKIDRALMSIGNFSQREGRKWRYQFASKTNLSAWRELFHKSANAGFENTSDILLKLLDTGTVFTDEGLDLIADEFIKNCEGASLFPWEYYYVKYGVFRAANYGKLGLYKSEGSLYTLSVMMTRTQMSQNTYQPFLKAAEGEFAKLDKDSLGQRLTVGARYIMMEDNAYVLFDCTDGHEIERRKVNRNADGIDTENRIEVLKNYVKQLLGLTVSEGDVV